MFREKRISPMSSIAPSGLAPVSSQTSLNSQVNLNAGRDFQNAGNYQFDQNNRFSSFPNLQNYNGLPSLATSGPLTVVQQGQDLAQQSLGGIPDNIRNPGTAGVVPYQINGGTGTLTVKPGDNGASAAITNVTNQGGSRVTGEVAVAKPNDAGQQITSGSLGISQLIDLGGGSNVRAGATVSSATGVGAGVEATLPGGITATATATNLNGAPSVAATVTQKPTPNSVSVGVGVNSTPTGSSATLNIGNIPFLGGTLGANGAVGTNNGLPTSSAGINARWNF
jgi:hypothetical protein